MYRLYLDDYVFYFDTLDEACEHLANLLKTMNLTIYWDKGVFEETHPPQQEHLSKIKKYTIKTKSPIMTLTLWHKGFQELDVGLTLYTIQKYLRSDTK
jgi:hypothetical protein